MHAQKEPTPIRPVVEHAAFKQSLLALRDLMLACEGVKLSDPVMGSAYHQARTILRKHAAYLR